MILKIKNRVGIIGASGWLGGHLIAALRERDWGVVGFSRSNRSSEKMEWREWSGEGEIDLSGLDAVINLAGESIDQRWTESRKVRFRKSRVDLTENLCAGISGSSVKVLLNASAIGFYGDRGDEKLSEEASVGEGYLAGLCRDWEEAVEVSPEIRVVFLRTGVVLGKGGGAWGKMSKIFRLGIGGRLGDGSQWMPWIHLDDEIRGIVHCLESEIAGSVNLAAPESVTNKEFTKAVGKALSRPTIFPAPAFMLKLVLGDFAEEGLLASCRVVPTKLLGTGFEFSHPTIESALTELAV